MVATAYTEVMSRSDFGQWVYDFRIHLDMTQTRFAEFLGVTLNTVQRWEYGTRRPAGSALALLQVMAKLHDFAQPPHVDTGRGPRKTQEG